MLRISILWFMLVLLVGCASSPMPPPEPIVTPQVRPTNQTAPMTPPPASDETPAPGVVITPLQGLDDIVVIEPHIALMLPLQSRDFARASEVLKEEFQAAAKLQTENPPYVKIYPLANEGEALANAYQKAIKAGARCVVGGITRDGATTLATAGIDKSIPTIALNEVDPSIFLSKNFYTISLSIDDEARQLAQQIINEGYTHIALLIGPSSLSKRVTAAFEQGYSRLGGSVAIKLPLSRNAAEYPKYKGYLQDADAVLIIGEAHVAKQVMPYIGKDLPIFATSQIYEGKNSSIGTNVDLQDVHFFDIPWLVDPSHVAVAVYPHNPKATSSELERLYALGIDAYRLAEIMTTRGTINNPVWLDGVTGTISLRDGHRFKRQLMPAYFDNNQVLPLKTSTNEQ